MNQVWISMTAGTALLLASIAYGQTFSNHPIPSRTIAGNVCASPDNQHVYFTLNTSIGRSDAAGNITEFRVPPGGTRMMGLVGCTFDGNGILHFSDQNNKILYQFNPLVATFKLNKIPPPHGGVAGAAYNTTDGLIYLMLPQNSAIRRFNPVTGTWLSVVLLPTGRFPHGPSSCNGNVWFAENTANRVAFITPAGVVSEFPLPLSNSKPFATVCAPDGSVYFTQNGNGRLGRIDGVTFAITTWATSSTLSQPRGISLTGDGRVCFAQYYVNKIGCMALGGSIISETELPIAGSGPNKLVLGPDGGIWFSQGRVSYVGAMKQLAE